METRVHRVFDPEDIAKVADTYHAWRSQKGSYEDVAGFCKSATLEEITDQDFMLTPGRYVGTEKAAGGDQFDIRFRSLKREFELQLKQSDELGHRIRSALAGISDLPALDGPFIHPKAAQRPKLLFVTASSRFRGRQLSPW